jgi:hypothetical protein
MPVDHRVLRGGAFNNNDRNVRCAYRNRNNPNNRNNNIGFRLVVSTLFLSLPKCPCALSEGEGFAVEALWKNGRVYSCPVFLTKPGKYRIAPLPGLSIFPRT